MIPRQTPLFYLPIDEFMRALNDAARLELAETAGVVTDADPFPNWNRPQAWANGRNKWRRWEEYHFTNGLRPSYMPEPRK